MTSPRLRQHDPKLSGLQLILMTAIAASKATASQSHQKPACKPRASCLKPKEIRQSVPAAAGGVLTCGNP
jgi:hypothetical protein